MRKRTVSLQDAEVTARARAAFRLAYGLEEERRRAAQIAAVPAVDWHGRTLRTLTCAGPYGKGPHLQYLPEAVLWSLIDLAYFVCPYHR